MGEFVEQIPLHSPHATEHSSPCFSQEYLRVTQSFLRVRLVSFSRASGAGGRTVILGSERFRTQCLVLMTGRPDCLPKTK